MFSMLHRHPLSKAAHLGVVSFFISMSLAVLDAVWSIFIDSFVNNASITGTISSLTTALYLVAFLFTGPVVERFSEKRLWMFSAAVMLVGYLGYFLASSLVQVLVIAASFSVVHVLLSQTQSVIIRDNADDVTVSEAEGIQYVFRNAGWLIAPLLGGFVADALQIRFVFLFSALFALLAILHMRTVKLNVIAHDAPTKFREVFRNIRSFMRNPKQRVSYVMNGGVNAWWGVIYVYGPLYLLANGYPPFAVGVFLACVVVPLVILEYPIGKWTQVYGHRRFLVLGYALLGGSGLLAAIFQEPLFVLGALVAGSIGAAMLEATRESYYFLITTQAQEEKFLGTWMTARYLFSAVTKIAVAGVLLVLSYSAAFAMLGAFMLVVSLIATRTVREDVASN